MKPMFMKNLQNMLRRSICLMLLAASSLSPVLSQEVVTINGKGFFTDDIERITFGEVDFYGLPAALAADSRFTLFSAALAETGLSDSLYYHFDPKYSVGKDSTVWATDDESYKPTEVYSTDYNIAYPEHRLRKFTLLAETDDVFRANGIRSLNDLKAYAKRTYDEVFPADAGITDPTNRRHSLNRFVAYHILPFTMSYNEFCNNFPTIYRYLDYYDRQHEDMADWYSTYMPEGMIKLSFPAGLDNKLYANRRGVADHADWFGQFVPGVRVANPADAPKADNGNIFLLDSILVYDLRAINIVHNDRIRMSCSTLSSDFMTSGARNINIIGTGHYYIIRRCYAFKAGAADGFTFDDSETLLFVICRERYSWAYQGSAIRMIGNGDVSIQLPVLPAGEWELRVDFWEGSFNVPVQFYLDDVACGEPFDKTTWETIGWKSDEELGDADTMLAFDREFHEAGWMKGCATYYPGGGSFSLRDIPSSLRRVLCTFASDGHTSHILRISPIAPEGVTAAMSLDFIEFCPRSIYDGDKPEDGWLYEKE